MENEILEAIEVLTEGVAILVIEVGIMLIILFIKLFN